MASHESYYNSDTSNAVPVSSQTPINARAAPPPPPPPKPTEASRTSTPTIPPVPPHPSVTQTQSYNQTSARSSPAPPPLPQTPTNAQSYPGQSQANHVNTYQTQQVATSFPQPQLGTAQPPPTDSGWLPDGLRDHTTADLHPLLSNPDQLDAFAKQHPAYRAALEPLQAAISTNIALAQHVAQLEAQVQQLRDQTGQLLLNHTSLQTQWRRKQTEMETALAAWGPRAMYSRLVAGINEQEALLRAVHESFVEGGAEGHEFYGGSGGGSGKASEKEVTEWVKRIREGTTVLEKRREMRQRWDEGRVGGWR